MGRDEEYSQLSREPRPIRGLRAPLFDRLIDETPGGHTSARPARIFDRRDLRESVRIEVGRILNTRCQLTGELARLAEGTVLDYGLPDFSALSATGVSDLQRLSEIIARKVAAGEPRLADVRVVLKPDPHDPKAVIGAMRASLRIGTVMEPVTFPLSIDSSSGIQVSEPV